MKYAASISLSQTLIMPEFAVLVIYPQVYRIPLVDPLRNTVLNPLAWELCEWPLVSVSEYPH